MMMVTYDDDKKQMQIQNNKQIRSKHSKALSASTANTNKLQQLQTSIDLSDGKTALQVKPMDLTVSLVPSSEAVGKQPLAGGYQLLVDYTQNEYFAKIDQLIRSRYSELASAQVFKVQRQVVSGYNYRLTYKTVQNTYYQAVVWVVPWENKFEVMSFNTVDGTDIVTQQQQVGFINQREEKLLTGSTQLVGNIQASSTVTTTNETMAPSSNSMSGSMAAATQSILAENSQTLAEQSKVGKAGAGLQIQTIETGRLSNEQTQQLNQAKKQSNFAIMATLSQLSNQLHSQKPSAVPEQKTDQQNKTFEIQTPITYNFPPLPSFVQQTPAQVRNQQTLNSANTQARELSIQGWRPIQQQHLSGPRQTVNASQWRLVASSNSSIKQQTDSTQMEHNLQLGSAVNKLQSKTQRTVSAIETAGAITNQKKHLETDASQTFSQPKHKIEQEAMPQIQQTNQQLKTERIEPLMMTYVSPPSSTVIASNTITRPVAPIFNTGTSANPSANGPTPIAPILDPAPVVHIHANQNINKASQPTILSSATAAELSNNKMVQLGDSKLLLGLGAASQALTTSQINISSQPVANDVEQIVRTNIQPTLQNGQLSSQSNYHDLQIQKSQTKLSGTQGLQASSQSASSATALSSNLASGSSQITVTQTTSQFNLAQGESNSIAFYSNNPYFLASDQLARSQYSYELSKSQITLVTVRRMSGYYYFVIVYETWQGRYEAKIVVKGNNYSLITFKKILDLDQKNPLCRYWDAAKCKQCVFRAYFDSDGQCQEVSRLCKTFDTLTGSCQSCYPGFLLDDGACYLTIRHSRNQNCRTVDKLGNCTACYFRYYLDDQNQCMQVSDQCKTWDGKGRCTTCYQGYDLSKGQCLVARS